MSTTKTTTTSDLLDQLNQQLAEIIKERDELRVERVQMIEALKEVEAMLNAELARDYESQSWAKKVRAALMTINQQRSTSE